MEELQSYHDNILKHVPLKFQRYLYSEINWDQRMLALKGPRGSGKTTLILQRIKSLSDALRSKAIYITADHYWFYTHNLVETADEFYKNGGRYLFIDEVHKYPQWSRELKNIYDAYPHMQIVFTSSSALDIYRGEADLSRRVITYNLSVLSFREYLEMNGHGPFEKISLYEILSDHRNIAAEILEDIQPLPLFKSYLQNGYLPIIREIKEKEIPIILLQIINTTLDSDLSYIENYNPGTAQKVKKLLGLLAESAPFKPNITSLARKLGVSRDSIYAWLVHLEKAGLINLLHRAKKGVSILQKPEKIYLENTNLSFALQRQPDKGALRETFLFNQLQNAKLKTTLPESGDFLIENKITLEVGGKNKKQKQIKDLKNAYLIKDDIETGFGNAIPLWLFGFLY